MLAQKEYKKKHDNVCGYIHWRLREKYGLEGAQQWYEHEPYAVIENKEYKFCVILQPRVIPRLKLDDQILSLLIKPRRKLRS